MIPSAPFVIVLTLNYNGRHLLDDTLSSYLQNDYPCFELVLIDNGSSDESIEYVQKKYPSVTILANGSNLGYSAGFNVGLEYAFKNRNAKYALITNNDVKADKNVITGLVKVAETDKKIGFTTGKVYYFDQPDVLQTVGKKEDPITWNGDHIGNGEKDIGQYDQVSERFFADDIFTLVSRRLYETTGGYDTTFFLQCEEYDWQARAKKAGFRIMYTPHAKIWHKESMTLGKWSPRKAYYDARNPMIVIVKHKQPEFFKKYFWHHVKALIMTSLVNTKKFRINMVVSIWCGFFSGLYWAFKNVKLSTRYFF